MTQPPLKGMKVVTVALNVPGPVAVAHLGKLGAMITKVEPPAGDPLKEMSSTWYDFLRAGQTLLTLDLKTSAGREQMDALIADADLLITSFRPSALKRLHLDWETLHAKHPHLCVVNIIGFPAPNEDVSGHDLTYQARLGLLAPPRLPVTLFADLACAERVVSVALGLLFNRSRSGQVDCSTVSLFDCIRDFTGPLIAGLTIETGILGGGNPFYGLYQTSDGWIALAALEPSFVIRVTTEFNLTEDVRSELTRIFLKRSSVEWEQWAVEHDVPIVAVKHP